MRRREKVSQRNALARRLATAHQHAERQIQPQQVRGDAFRVKRVLRFDVERRQIVKIQRANVERFHLRVLKRHPVRPANDRADRIHGARRGAIKKHALTRGAGGHDRRPGGRKMRRNHRRFERRDRFENATGRAAVRAPHVIGIPAKRGGERLIAITAQRGILRHQRRAACLNVA